MLAQQLEDQGDRVGPLGKPQEQWLTVNFREPENSKLWCQPLVGVWGCQACSSPLQEQLCSHALRDWAPTPVCWLHTQRGFHSWNTICGRGSLTDHDWPMKQIMVGNHD